MKLHEELYPNQLKPKHHFLLHYPRIMSEIGPLSKISSIRFEATHRIGKSTTKTSTSHVNFCRTIALKYPLILIYRFLSKECQKNIFSTCPIKAFYTQKDVPNFNEYFHLISSSEIFRITSWVSFYNQKIVPNCVIVEHSENGPQFYLVHTLFVNLENQLKVIVKHMQDCFYEYNLQAYKIIWRKLFIIKILNSKRHNWRCDNISAPSPERIYLYSKNMALIFFNQWLK